MRMARSLFAVALSAVILVAAGCGGGSAPASKTAPAKAPETSTAPQAAAPKETMKVTMAVGGKSSIIYLPPALAEYNNFFKEEGIEIQVEDLKGGAQAAQALVSGQVDVASMAVEHAVKSAAQGVDLVMLTLYTRYPAITLVVDAKLKDKVKSVKDLKGMKVGVTSPGSATHKALLTLMDKNGMKPADIEIVGVGTSGMPAAIESGKVQAAFGLDPWVTQMTTSGKAYVIYDLRTKKDTQDLYGDDYPFVGMVVRREMLQKNPEMAERLVRAVVKANKFLAGNSPETITSKLPPEIKGEDEALYLASLRANLEAFSPDGIASPQGLKIVIESLKQDKVIPDNVTITADMIFDGTLAKKVK